MTSEHELEARIMLKRYAAKIAAELDAAKAIDTLVKTSAIHRKQILNIYVHSGIPVLSIFSEDEIIAAIEAAIFRLHHIKSISGHAKVSMQELPAQAFKLMGKMLYVRRLNDITEKIRTLNKHLDEIDDKIYEILLQLNRTDGNDEAYAVPTYVVVGHARAKLIAEHKMLTTEFAHTLDKIKTAKKQRRALAAELGLDLQHALASKLGYVKPKPQKTQPKRRSQRRIHSTQSVTKPQKRS